MTTASLIKKYREAKAAYYNGSPIMDDDTFDALEREIAVLAPTEVKRVGTERSGKQLLPTPMGSLNQVHNQDDLSRWAAIYPKQTVVVATEKIDGNSVLLQYKNGILVNSFSRGNGIQGANNLRHTSQMSDIPDVLPTTFTGTIRGEIAIQKDAWPECQALATTHSGKEYANARNFTAGFLNGKTGNTDLYKYFKFIAFELFTDGPAVSKLTMLTNLTKMGFTTPSYKVLSTDTASFTKYRELCTKMVADSKFEADGIVVDVDDFLLRDKGVILDDLNPVHAIKIKPEAGAATTTVTHVEWNASKDGLLKPTVHFEPVQLVGVTIRKASGYNAKYVFDNGIGTGALVAITRQGDVIPRVNEVLMSVEAEMPDGCKWNDTGVDLVSTNSMHEEAVSLQILEHFFDKLEVEFVGAGNVAKLFEYDVTTPLDAIRKPESTYVDAFGSNGKKAYTSLQSKLSDIRPARLFAALGSFGRGMGERKLTALFKVVPVIDLLEGRVTADHITSVEGFEEKSADKILENVPVAKQQFDAVLPFIKFTTVKSASTGKLTGQVFCPTGVRFTTDIVEKIASQGGEVTDTFSSKVTVLVAKDPNSGSSKVQKALDRGIKVISLAELGTLL